jgi:hypothetical protein
MRKLYAVLVPLFAMAAFVAVPAIAQAQPQWEVCKEVAKETGSFSEIKCATPKTKGNFEWTKPVGVTAAVLVNSKNVSGKSAKLKTPGGSITCTTVKDESYLWNRALRGRDINEVEFTGCTTAGALAGCKVKEPIVVEAATRLEEEAATKKIFNKYTPVSGEPFTEITVEGTCTVPAGTYPVVGTARGEMTEHENKQKFNAGEKTLEFLGEKAEFEGETEQEGAAKKEGIRVS